MYMANRHVQRTGCLRSLHVSLSLSTKFLEEELPSKRTPPYCVTTVASLTSKDTVPILVPANSENALLREGSSFSLDSGDQMKLKHEVVAETLW